MKNQTHNPTSCKGYRITNDADEKLNILTSLIFWTDGAAINTTNGEYSAVRSTLRAWGSTSKIATLPSACILRIVSNFVPYMASSWVPKKAETSSQFNWTNCPFLSYHIPSIRWQQYQPSSRHARRKNNFSHFPLLFVVVSSYLDWNNQTKQKKTKQKKQETKNEIKTFKQKRRIVIPRQHLRGIGYA